MPKNNSRIHLIWYAIYIWFLLFLVSYAQLFYANPSDNFSTGQSFLGGGLVLDLALFAFWQTGLVIAAYIIWQQSKHNSKSRALNKASLGIWVVSLISLTIAIGLFIYIWGVYYMFDEFFSSNNYIQNHPELFDNR